MSVTEDGERLRDTIRALDRVVVAFSGGADSALVAWVARQVLGRERSRAVTAVSASLAAEQRADCAALAREWDLQWNEVHTDELTRPGYRANGPDRCAHCKDALLDVLAPLAEAEGAVVVLGTNLDDLGDHRPGQDAAAERGARAPLVEAGLGKAQVRALARAEGLRTWDKPAAPCLASRIPYGTPVDAPLLAAVEQAEAALRRLGFAVVRVRHHGDVARVEVPAEHLAGLLDRRDEVVAAVREAGWRYVSVDLDGFRSGSLNEVLPSGAVPVDPPRRRT